MSKRTRILFSFKDHAGNPIRIVLWNDEQNPAQFHGGLAELVDIPGERKRRDFVVKTHPVEVGNATYMNPVDPYVAFISRKPTEEQKKTRTKPYMGPVASIDLYKERKHVGRVFWVTTNKDGFPVISGSFDPLGIKFDDKYHVVKAPSTVPAFVELRGGLKDEVLKDLPRKK